MRKEAEEEVQIRCSNQSSKQSEGVDKVSKVSKF